MRQNANKPNDLVISIINANLAVKIHDIISWRCRLALCAFIFISELIFFAIYEMDLEFVSTIIFIIIVFYVLRLFWSIFGNALNPILFPEIPNEDERELYVAQSLKNLNQIILLVHEKMCLFISYLKQLLQNPSLKTEIYFFAVLAILFIFFSIIGTFWFCFFAYHFCLVLPKILKLTAFQKYLEEEDEEYDEPQHEKIKTD